MGVLVIRLSSYRNKINTLERLLKDENISSTKRETLEEELALTIHSRDTSNISLVKAFRQEYKFSDWLIMYDTASASLKKGVQSGIFLNRQLELDPSIHLNDRSYCVVQWKHTEEESSSGLRSLVVMDREYQQLERPFPYYTRSNNPAKFALRSFGDVADLSPRFWLELVRDFNFQLEAFYLRFH